MVEEKAGPRRRAPTHPGRILASAIEEGRISARQVALAIGVSAQAVGNVISEKSAVTADMALRLGKYFGNGPEIWVGMQTDYDLWHTRTAIKDQLAAIKPLAK